MCSGIFEVIFTIVVLRATTVLYPGYDAIAEAALEWALYYL